MTLRQFLADTGMTQAEFAALVKAGDRTVGNWVRDGAPLRERALLLACRRLAPQEPANALRSLIRAVAAISDGADEEASSG